MSIVVLERRAFGSIDYAWIWEVRVSRTPSGRLSVTRIQTYSGTGDQQPNQKRIVRFDAADLVSAIQDLIEVVTEEGLDSDEILIVSRALRELSTDLSDAVEAIARNWTGH